MKAVHDNLASILDDMAWLYMPAETLTRSLERALAAFPEELPEEGAIITDLSMNPSPRLAKALLAFLLTQPHDKHDLVVAAGEIQGYLKGYPLGSKAKKVYFCRICKKTGTKLWRVGASSHVEGYCSLHAMEQAGYPDTIDGEGRNTQGEHNEYGSDQIYNPKKGLGLVPWVVDEDGSTWGYTSVPPAGCVWWRNLPTR